MQLSQFPATSHCSCAAKSRSLPSLTAAYVMIRAWLVPHVCCFDCKALSPTPSFSSPHKMCLSVRVLSVQLSHWATVSMLWHTHCTRSCSRSCSRSRNCVNHHHTSMSHKSGQPFVEGRATTQGRAMTLRFQH